jgi:hypothetical protein
VMTGTGSTGWPSLGCDVNESSVAKYYGASTIYI